MGWVLLVGKISIRVHSILLSGGRKGGREGGREGREGGRGEWMSLVDQKSPYWDPFHSPLCMREGGKEGGRER